jgi:hypothetical protein
MRQQLAKVNALREPHRGVILQVKSGAPKGCDKELRPFFGQTLTLSPCGMPSDEGVTARGPRSAAEWEGGAFKGKL